VVDSIEQYSLVGKHGISSKVTNRLIYRETKRKETHHEDQDDAISTTHEAQRPNTAC